MAFEVELDWGGDLATGLINDTKGHTEEIRIKAPPDALAGLIRCIEEGAAKFGYSARDLLKETKSIKLQAHGIITDTLSRRNGARIGLVLSEGHQNEVYFEGSGDNPIIGSVVARDMVVGIKEETGHSGENIFKVQQEEVKNKVRHLLEFGSGIVVVSLRNATVNSANERSVKEIIESDYPRHYLGAVPVLVASDFSDDPDDFIRTSVCLLNAYTWFNLDSFLRRFEALLQEWGYNYSLLVRQADGEMTHIHKVTPLKTCASDQIAFVRSICG